MQVAGFDKGRGIAIAINGQFKFLPQFLAEAVATGHIVRICLPQQMAVVDQTVQRQACSIFDGRQVFHGPLYGPGLRPAGVNNGQHQVLVHLKIFAELMKHQGAGVVTAEIDYDAAALVF